jgi:replicative superfamily II helicase
MLFLCCSAGKSFVAEVLMLRRILSSQKIAILVLPYVSLCAEKVNICTELGDVSTVHYLSVGLL